MKTLYRLACLTLLGLLASDVVAHKAIDDEADSKVQASDNSNEDSTNNPTHEGLETLDQVVAAQEQELDPIQKIIKFKIEIGFGVLFLLTFINFWVGSATNRKIAGSWHKKMLPIVQENFVYVGLDDGIEQTA